MDTLLYPQPPKTAPSSTQSPNKRRKDAAPHSELDKRIDDFLSRLNSGEIEHSMFSKEQNGVLRKRLHSALKEKLVRLERQFAEKQRKLNELGLLNERMNKVRSHAMYRLAVNRDLRVEELQKVIVAKMEEESAQTRSKLAKGRNRGTMFKMLLSLAQQDVMHRGYDALENADVAGDLKEARGAGGFVHRRGRRKPRRRRRRKSRSVSGGLKGRARLVKPGKQLESFREDEEAGPVGFGYDEKDRLCLMIAR